MTDLPRLIDTWLDAYGEPDPQRRAALVERTWAPDGDLIDPPLAARGYEAIVAQADALLSHYPGHRFRRTTGVDAHHGHARYGWALVDPGEREVLAGTDVIELDADGRLRRITGFFGPMPPREAAG